MGRAYDPRMRTGRPRFPWEEWVLGAGLALLFLGLVGAPVSLLMDAPGWTRASLVAVVASVLLMRLVSAFGRSYPEASPLDRAVRRFRRELSRDLKALR
jgi:hypothetical protein